MGLLDPIPNPRYTPKSKYRSRDNFEELQNLAHDKVTEDFSDSPHAESKHEDSGDC